MKRKLGFGTPAIVLSVIAIWSACRPGDRHGHSRESSGASAAIVETTDRKIRAETKYVDAEDARRASEGCISCHRQTDSASMHPAAVRVHIACTDCHGGDSSVVRPDQVSMDRPFGADFQLLMQKAHPAARFPRSWESPETGEYLSANPVRSYTLLNYESPEFIQFVNPGDLRVADRTCGPCHGDVVHKVRRSMMTHGAQLWGAVLYNNGSYPYKVPRFGESYGVNGVPQRMYGIATPEERRRGVLSYLDPLPRWEITQMGNILRAFERGGRASRRELELGLPNPFEDPGRPDMKLSDRGLGTQLATDPVFLNIQKTRLLDPLLSFLGTNDHPGDYRSSGCSACHVVYANDRSPVHSGEYSPFGNLGLTQSSDPTLRKDESGHPIRHEMVRAMPSSQCVVCHVHPGTSFANSYFGFTWWDNETNGEWMYPRRQGDLTAEQVAEALMENPEAASLRGLWSNLRPTEESHAGGTAGENFLENVRDLNSRVDKTQFADFHSHGWVFRAVFKQDRKGRMLDRDDRPVSNVTPKQLSDAVAFQSKPALRSVPRLTPPTGAPVHLKDIHLERGMHCVDCHFEQDMHGDGRLYGEVRNAIAITCVDCHGTIRERATLIPSGPAGGRSFETDVTPNGRRFEWEKGRLYQRSALDVGLEWEVPQLADFVDPRSDRYNAKAAYAKTLQRGGSGQGSRQCPDSQLAHGSDSMTCYACHTSWMTSCFGCHLPMRANFRMPMLHNEGEVLRNFTTYNYQVLRDDVFMLGRDSTIKGGLIAPVRSSSAVIVGSANANREWIYSQQQTISAEGYSGQAFNPHYPHAVRRTETRKCTDCHLSEQNDNNAWMAQLLLQGTNLVNFLGRYVYVATGHEGFEAVVATEQEEPQAVLGSSLHSLAYPDEFQKHVESGRRLEQVYEHGMNDGLFPSRGEILDLQLRGEYLYAARGEGGFYAYDVANIDNKGFSERIVTAPVSPLGQSLHVRTRYATSVASPTTLGVDPTRRRVSDDPDAPATGILQPARPDHVNQEQAIHPVYAFLYVSDYYEGLVIVGDPKQGVGTLLDGGPTNNSLKRLLAYNPGGRLDGAVYVTLAGHYAYVCCKRGLVIVDVSDPGNPSIASEIGEPHIQDARSVAIQFRYAFVCDREGMKVVDVTMPESARAVTGAVVRLEDAHRVYLARTYAFVAGGTQGLVIIDIEKPESPFIEQVFTADGEMNDARDVKVGMTNASAFAYVADGKNGLRVVQLFSPDETLGFGGFSPKPTPRLIATRLTHGPALAVSKGLDRDRAVDESGHQVAVFGRIGARPLNLEEQRRFYLRNGEVYRVDDDVPSEFRVP